MGPEEQLCQRDQKGLLQRLEYLSVEDTRQTISSQYIRDEDRSMPRDPGLNF